MVIRFTTLMLILVSRAMFAAQCAVKWYAGKYGRLYARLFGQYDVSLEVCTYIVSFWQFDALFFRHADPDARKNRYDGSW